MPFISIANLVAEFKFQSMMDTFFFVECGLINYVRWDRIDVVDVVAGVDGGGSR